MNLLQAWTKATARIERLTAELNPDCAVDIYCGLKILAATLVSRFCFLTYL